MNIDTTININRKTLTRIDRAAAFRGVRREAIIAAICRIAGMRGRWLKGEWMRIRYQRRDALKDWVRPHVRFTSAEYAYFNDMRDVLKMSVSFFISYAVEHYLDEIIEKMVDDPDNYRIWNYAVTAFQIENVSGMILYWGIPPKFITGGGLLE